MKTLLASKESEFEFIQMIKKQSKHILSAI